SIKKGDLGFLLNVSRDELLGIFVAESNAALSIVPEAWGGGFPVQVKVRLIGKLQRISATISLEKHIQLRWLKGRNYKIPFKSTYGPDITEKVLGLFKPVAGLTINSRTRRFRLKIADGNAGPSGSGKRSLQAESRGRFK